MDAAHPHGSGTVEDDGDVGLGRAGLIGVHLAFLPAGAGLAMYGPTLPEFAARYGLTAGEVGAIIGTHSLATLVGVLAWVLVGPRPHPAASGAVWVSLLGAGFFGIAGAASWPLTLGSAALVGLGFGALVVTLNMWITRAYDRHRVTVLASTSAVFGVGAVAGPGAIGLLGPAEYAAAYAFFAALALLAGLLLAFVALRSAPPPPVVAQAVSFTRGRAPLVAAFMVVLALYVGLESGIGGWLATYLIGLGATPAAAASATAWFWVSFTLGRGAGAFIAHRIPEQRLLPLQLAGATVVLLVALWPGAAVAMFVAVGVVIALVFPTLLSWFTRVFGQPTLSVALLFSSGSIGAALLPPLIGVLVDVFGVAAIPISLAVAAGVGTLIALALGAVLGRDEARRRNAAVAVGR